MCLINFIALCSLLRMFNTTHYKSLCYVPVPIYIFLQRLKPASSSNVFLEQPWLCRGLFQKKYKSGNRCFYLVNILYLNGNKYIDWNQIPCLVFLLLKTGEELYLDQQIDALFNQVFFSVCDVLLTKIHFFFQILTK